METNDLTLQVLISIRDEIRNTNARLDQTNERIDTARVELREQISDTNQRLGALTTRVITMDLRLSTQVSHLADELRAQRALDKRLTRCERDITALKRRMQ